MKITVLLSSALIVCSLIQMAYAEDQSTSTSRNVILKKHLPMTCSYSHNLHSQFTQSKNKDTVQSEVLIHNASRYSIDAENRVHVTLVPTESAKKKFGSSEVSGELLPI